MNHTTDPETGFGVLFRFHLQDPVLGQRPRYMGKDQPVSRTATQPDNWLNPLGYVYFSLLRFPVIHSLLQTSQLRVWHVFGYSSLTFPAGFALFFVVVHLPDRKDCCCRSQPWCCHVTLWSGPEAKRSDLPPGERIINFPRVAHRKEQAHTAKTASQTNPRHDEPWTRLSAAARNARFM